MLRLPLQRILQLVLSLLLLLLQTVCLRRQIKGAEQSMVFLLLLLLLLKELPQQASSDANWVRRGEVQPPQQACPYNLRYVGWLRGEAPQS